MFVTSWHGIINIGAVATDVNTYLHKKDYAYFLNCTRAKVAIVDQATPPEIEKAAAQSKY